MVGRKKKTPPLHRRKNTGTDKRSTPALSAKSNTTETDRNDDSQDSVSIVLEPVITLAEVNHLRETLLDYLEAQHILVDVSKVEHIDTAGLQLMIAFSKALDKRGGKIVCQGESTAYSNTAELLNLTSALGPIRK